MTFNVHYCLEIMLNNKCINDNFYMFVFCRKRSTYCDNIFRSSSPATSCRVQDSIAVCIAKYLHNVCTLLV